MATPRVPPQLLDRTAHRAFSCCVTWPCIPGTMERLHWPSCRAWLPCLFRFFSSLFFFPHLLPGWCRRKLPVTLQVFQRLQTAQGSNRRCMAFRFFCLPLLYYLYSFVLRRFQARNLGFLPSKLRCAALLLTHFCDSCLLVIALIYFYCLYCLFLMSSLLCLYPFIPISPFFIPISPFSGHSRAYHECGCASGFRGRSTMLLNSY